MNDSLSSIWWLSKAESHQYILFFGIFFLYLRQNEGAEYYRFFTLQKTYIASLYNILYVEH